VLVVVVRDNGETIHILDSELGPLRLPLLDVQAVAATFKSTDEENAPLPRELDSSCLLYLGRTDQELAVYDVAEHVTYRFSSDHIMVELATETDRAPVPTRAHNARCAWPLHARPVVQNSLTVRRSPVLERVAPPGRMWSCRLRSGVNSGASPAGIAVASPLGAT